MLIYIHFPFCIQKCKYCAFFSKEFVPEMGEIYFKALLTEIEFWSKSLGPKSIESIYIGGGTPSLFPLSWLEKVLTLLFNRFRVSSKIEITLEINPDSCSEEKARFWRKLGINRASLGVQSFFEENLRLLGRVHSSSQSRQAYYLLRKSGFKNINLDLMFGLPGQSVGRWLEEIKKGISLRPEHFSCYGFSLEPGTYFALNKEKFSWPSEEEFAKMFIYGSEYLEGAGYLQYEISNFARMGYVCQHNLGYWEGKNFLGLGPSAVSTINGRRWQNPSNVKKYALRVNKGFKDLPLEKIAGVKEINEMIMLSLRTCKGLNLKKFKRKTGISFTEHFAKSLEVMYQKRLVSFRKGYVRLTREGMLLSNSIIPHFFLEEQKCLDGDKN